MTIFISCIEPNRPFTHDRDRMHHKTVANALGEEVCEINHTYDVPELDSEQTRAAFMGHGMRDHFSFYQSPAEFSQYILLLRARNPQLTDIDILSCNVGLTAYNDESPPTGFAFEVASLLLTAGIRVHAFFFEDEGNEYVLRTLSSTQWSQGDEELGFYFQAVEPEVAQLNVEATDRQILSRILRLAVDNRQLILDDLGIDDITFFNEYIPLAKKGYLTLEGVDNWDELTHGHQPSDIKYISKTTSGYRVTFINNSCVDLDSHPLTQIQLTEIISPKGKHFRRPFPDDYNYSELKKLLTSGIGNELKADAETRYRSYEMAMKKQDNKTALLPYTEMRENLTDFTDIVTGSMYSELSERQEALYNKELQKTEKQFFKVLEDFNEKKVSVIALYNKFIKGANAGEVKERHRTHKLKVLQSARSVLMAIPTHDSDYIAHQVERLTEAKLRYASYNSSTASTTETLISAIENFAKQSIANPYDMRALFDIEKLQKGIDGSSCESLPKERNELSVNKVVEELDNFHGNLELFTETISRVSSGVPEILQGDINQLLEDIEILKEDASELYFSLTMDYGIYHDEIKSKKQCQNQLVEHFQSFKRHYCDMVKDYHQQDAEIVEEVNNQLSQ